MPFHPELHTCPVCGQIRPKDAQRRNRLWYLVNTVLVSFVALVVAARAIAAGDVQVGMTPEDCQVARTLAVQTRELVQDLEADPERARADLAEISIKWRTMSQNYVPGKFSWSTSGREHNWLERLADSSDSVASGEPVRFEEIEDVNKYLVELTKLHPRFCSAK